ncbi:hypothetical protein ACVWWR_001318 [Bradyrhizobium sp. LM3.2]
MLASYACLRLALCLIEAAAPPNGGPGLVIRIDQTQTAGRFIGAATYNVPSAERMPTRQRTASERMRDPKPKRKFLAASAPSTDWSAIGKT